MKYIGRHIGLIIVLMAAMGLPGRAQSSYVASGTAVANLPVTDTDQAILTIKKRVDEVNVLFIATNRHGKFVRDLNQSDFTILDDHKPPEAILNFKRETDLPIQMGLLLDTSASVNSRFDFEQAAAVAFFQHVIRPRFDQAFVMGFNGHGKLAQDFTDNVQLLDTGIHSLHSGGGTALYDAIFRACKDKLSLDHSDRPIRRAVIVISDGEDNQSEVSRAQAIEAAQRAEVIVYAISTNDSPMVLRGDKVLELLADATGGRAFFPSKMKDITNSFAAIEDELRSQYVVSYKPADFDADGRFRSIQISANKKDLEVRARRGYYAPRQ